jgi:hypothetical protein
MKVLKRLSLDFMFLSDLRKKNLRVAKDHLSNLAGVVKPQPFNNSKTSSRFWLDFARKKATAMSKSFCDIFVCQTAFVDEKFCDNTPVWWGCGWGCYLGAEIGEFDVGFCIE